MATKFLFSPQRRFFEERNSLPGFNSIQVERRQKMAVDPLVICCPARIFRATVVQLAKNIGRTAVVLDRYFEKHLTRLWSNLNIETFWRPVEMKLAL